MKDEKYLARLDRERINLSLSLQNSEERKIILLNKMKFNLKVSERISLCGHDLIKYLILIGLDKLNEEYGQVNKIFSNKKGT
jgi:hypothetical protein